MTAITHCLKLAPAKYGLIFFVVVKGNWLNLPAMVAGNNVRMAVICDF